MKKRFLILVVPILLALALTGCDQMLLGISMLHPVGGAVSQSDGIAETTPIPSHSVTGIDYVMDSLRTAGAEVTLGEQISQPFFEVTGQIIHVNGEDVQVFEFADETAANNAASQISPDGSSTGTTMINWMAPPHFYRAGKVITLYIGNDAAIVELLKSVFGEQFAGR